MLINASTKSFGKEPFSSTAHMHVFKVNEQAILDDIENYVVKEKSRLQNIRRYVCISKTC